MAAKTAEEITIANIQGVQRTKLIKIIFKNSFFNIFIYKFISLKKLKNKFLMNILLAPVFLNTKLH